MFLNKTILLPLLIAGFFACNSYQKVLKSDDLEFKMTKAKEYYHKGDYFKAIPLFEELIRVYKGTKNVEDIYYFYADAQYQEENYLTSAYHFRNFARTYSQSEYADDAQFMSAMSYFNLSPSPGLDQGYTYKAIDAFQLFINSYPRHEKTEEANEQIEKLRRKLEEKAFKSALLYYDLEQYKAAKTAFENVLAKYPDIRNRELIYFLILRSSFLLAEKSVAEKKEERYNAAVEAYYFFIDRFPDSMMIKEAEKIYETSVEKLNKIKKDEHI